MFVLNVAALNLRGGKICSLHGNCTEHDLSIIRISWLRGCIITKKSLNGHHTPFLMRGWGLGTRLTMHMHMAAALVGTSWTTYHLVSTNRCRKSLFSLCRGTISGTVDSFWSGARSIGTRLTVCIK